MPGTELSAECTVHSRTDKEPDNIELIFLQGKSKSKHTCRQGEFTVPSTISLSKV